MKDSTCYIDIDRLHGLINNRNMLVKRGSGKTFLLLCLLSGQIQVGNILNIIILVNTHRDIDYVPTEMLYIFSEMGISIKCISKYIFKLIYNDVVYKIEFCSVLDRDFNEVFRDLAGRRLGILLFNMVDYFESTKEYNQFNRIMSEAILRKFIIEPGLFDVAEKRLHISEVIDRGKKYIYETSI